MISRPDFEIGQEVYVHLNGTGFRGTYDQDCDELSDDKLLFLRPTMVGNQKWIQVRWDAIQALEY